MNVQDFMYVSGIPIKLVGYEYVRVALETSIADPNKKITAICEEIAMKYGSKYPVVERNIRTSIRKGYENLSDEIKKKLFNGKERVTTAEYIKGISYALRNNLI